MLGTRPSAQRGWQTQYGQGVGSFSTFDQYLRVSYGGQRWSASTRAVYSTSDNDFRYTNYDKMELVYGPDGAVVDTYHPVERNRSGYFRDLHLLQETLLQSRRRHALRPFGVGTSARNAGCPSSRPTIATT